VVISGDGAFSSEVMSKIAGNDANGSYYTIMSLPPDSSKQFSKFKVDFVKKYNENPDVWSVLAYDATFALYKAMLSCKDISGTEVMNKLHNEVDFQGLSGRIKFDSHGEVQKTYSIYLYNNGQYKLFKY